jgi:hypothetical protein
MGTGGSELQIILQVAGGGLVNAYDHRFLQRDPFVIHVTQVAGLRVPQEAFERQASQKRGSTFGGEPPVEPGCNPTPMRIKPWR